MDFIEKDLICGLVFFIEITFLYIIDDKGNICQVNGKKEIIGKFSHKNSYAIHKLNFKEIDNRNYHIYYFNDKTNFMNLQKSINENFAIIKIIFLDEIKQIYNPKLKINDAMYNIVDKIQFFPLIVENESAYNLQSFELNINNNINIFKTFIYKGEINVIHCGLKENNKSNKNYEILYLSKESENLPKFINVSGYKIEEYDKFSCSNRIRFNIMNIEKDDNI